MPAKKHPNVTLVETFFEHVAADNLEGIQSVVSETIEWHIPGHHPLAGTKKGIAELLAFFAQVEKLSFQSTGRFLEASDDMVVDVHRGWCEYDGLTMDMNWVLTYEIREGKIARVQNFSGDQHAADAFFWQAYALKPLPDRIA